MSALEGLMYKAFDLNTLCIGIPLRFCPSYKCGFTNLFPQPIRHSRLEKTDIPMLVY